MSLAAQRWITFADTTVSLCYEGDAASRIIDYLFRHVPESTAHVPVQVYRVLTLASAPLRLYEDEQLIYQGDSEAYLASLLLGRICHTLAGASDQGLVFHAAGLARNGRGVLLPGTMGAGKSTLAAWLVGKGTFDYLTDELVYVPLSSERFYGFARPFNLKPPTRSVLETALALDAASLETAYTHPKFDLLLPDHLRARAVRQTAPLSLAIFPAYVPDATLELQALSTAQCAKALLEALVNARNLPDFGVAESLRLARCMQGYRLRYHSFGQLKSQIEVLVDKFLRKL